MTTMPLQAKLLQLVRGQSGHFQMESGYHTDQWFELDRLFLDPAALGPMVSALTAALQPLQAEFICGPAVGGAKLAALIADELGAMPLATARSEPPGASGLFPVKYQLSEYDRRRVAGKSVVIVDDAISAGSAVRGTSQELKSHEARVVAIASLFVFGTQADAYAGGHGLPLVTLARVPFALWLPTECPLCRQGLSLERVSDVLPPSGQAV